MNKLALGIIILIIVGAGGWYVIRHAPDRADQQAAAEGEPFTLSVSFACADGTHFIAELADATNLNIIVDGTTARTVPLSPDARQTFENADYAYAFAGEQVTVTTKATGAKTACTQPVDPNNAPVNFGDADDSGARTSAAE